MGVKMIDFDLVLAVLGVYAAITGVFAVYRYTVFRKLDKKISNKVKGK